MCVCVYGMNITKHVQNQYADNYKIVLKDIREDLKRGLHHIQEEVVFPPSIPQFNV